MKLARYRDQHGNAAVGAVNEDVLRPLALGRQFPTLSSILEERDPLAAAESLIDRGASTLALSTVGLLSPIDQQEVWAAGVTYRRSQQARMQESKESASVYDRVYAAERPEIFFKATPHRVAGPGGALRVRQDSRWTVPEPELALVLNSRLELVGFTVGNDMSARDIEGENPLYLPQAKVYDACCGLGPWITLASALPTPASIGIRLAIRRGAATVFSGQTSTSQMARRFADLIDWLGRDNSFPQGACLLTGTGIVPADDFSLEAGDIVEIEIEGIGLLSNPIVRGN